MIEFRVAGFRPTIRAGKQHRMKVLTKKSQETQAVLFGTTFVERIPRKQKDSEGLGNQEE
jgi:hypothetical protein